MPKSKTEEERRFDIEVGSRIERLRVERRVRQGELAKAIDVTPQQLYSYETGQNGCPSCRLRMIAGFFGIEIGALVPEIDVTLCSAERPPVLYRADRSAKRMVELAQRDAR